MSSRTVRVVGLTSLVLAIALLLWPVQKGQTLLEEWGDGEFVGFVRGHDGDSVMPVVAIVDGVPAGDQLLKTDLRDRIVVASMFGVTALAAAARSLVLNRRPAE
jgi:hypothetical protein